MPANKLREATNSSARSATARRSHNIFMDDPIVSGPRNSRTKKKMVEVDTSDEENLDDEEEDEVDEDEDAEGDEDDDVDADGDVDMDDVPPQPPVSKRQAKPTAAAGRGQVKSVEAKEMENDDDEDDQELSELDSDAEGELDDQEMGGAAEDEELEDEEEEEDDEEDEDDEDMDLSKMTKRQRGSLGNDFLQLPMEPQVKKHLTAEEHAMRRAEMARRRKNLSEKRNEEEKMDTINRLLKKQAPKRRGRAAATEAEGTPTVQEPPEPPKPDPTMIRWVSGSNGVCRVAVPEELFGTPAGRLFGEAPSSNGQRKLVEEV
ncbi:hypothetical protein DTO021D3_471 [Paecilomyces variotii]|nr:hypothetical protein DTO032I3_380 [Paecilomyces variotii]KAJ9283134.1 hypothetical protein DTO021D3_471 [Paecilomyces variotii]KAJ9346765.1 hypothetical protein DTO027B6_332 [Paecilomyces variotii]KAJ9393688.1 hypothetical protein DTO032I4_459 [Paecilomyces variotii]